MTPHPNQTGRPAPSRGRPREITLAVGAPAHGGHCVARPVDDPGGRVIFVRHSLPGETVRARLTEMTSRTWRADAVEILQASPDRVDSVWPEAGPAGVGGGELAHVALDAQRTWKRWVLADCLRRIGGQEVADAVASLPEAASGAAVPVEPMPTDAEAQASTSARRRALAGTATRTRVSLTVTDDGEPGMHAFRSGAVLPLRRLPLAVAAITEIGLLERPRWRAHYRPGMRIEAVAPSGGEPVVLLDDRLLTAQARSTGRRRVQEVVDVSALGLGELTYSVHAEGFWQVHVDAPRVLVERVVRAALGEDLDRAAGSRVLELYSGAGLFTLPLAALVGGAGQVLSLEGDEQAVRDARRTLHDHPAARLAAGRVSPRSVRELAGSFTGDRPDVVVLDPPRQGAGREVIEAVAALGAERIVLVACDPAALARDLGTLLHAGYELGSLSALDMFPHTHHFETIAVLDRA
ncbi:class I SAM-dependent RNA methyltransferase [Actinomyces johnsonii]|uniref:Class I SAM-dependent RNA methyltransferase n=2 Tax=Actinomyces johnsonii TaxID=544581 RepID=A0A508A4Y5_9ACTO|nr:TRAM domain-containing protein [Actinomyces johnsonii]KAA8744123.1 class I SAM-dependent RNA methyltransferase [Actinomyces johnsonii]TQD43833.1 class I SAM-dependent RNA methyltransferase [Actinomyces johnsonii]